MIASEIAMIRRDAGGRGRGRRRGRGHRPILGARFWAVAERRSGIPAGHDRAVRQRVQVAGRRGRRPRGSRRARRGRRRASRPRTPAARRGCGRRPRRSSSAGARNQSAPASRAPHSFCRMPPIGPTVPSAVIVPVPATVSPPLSSPGRQRVDDPEREHHAGARAADVVELDGDVDREVVVGRSGSRR